MLNPTIVSLSDSIEFTYGKNRTIFANIALIVGICIFLFGVLIVIADLTNSASWIVIAVGSFIISFSSLYKVQKQIAPKQVIIRTDGIYIIEKNGESIMLPVSLFSEGYLIIGRHHGRQKNRHNSYSNAISIRGSGGIEIVLAVFESGQVAQDILNKISDLINIQVLPVYDFLSTESFRQFAKVIPPTDTTSIAGLSEIKERLIKKKLVQLSKDGRIIRFKDRFLKKQIIISQFITITLVSVFLSSYFGDIDSINRIIIMVFVLLMGSVVFLSGIWYSIFDLGLWVRPYGLQLRKFFVWQPLTDANLNTSKVDISRNQLAVICNINKTQATSLIEYYDSNRLKEVETISGGFTEALKQPFKQLAASNHRFSGSTYSEIIAIYSIITEIINRD